ncbi:MAG: hypothetical protein JRJ84_15365 [Deltaproteobacteria bacterium]|nr:hypothetical protein [Deltaproteobacteria bacterium]
MKKAKEESRFESDQFSRCMTGKPRLGALGCVANEKQTEAHKDLEDAEAAAEAAQKLVEELRAKLPPEVVEEYDQSSLGPP